MQRVRKSTNRMRYVWRKGFILPLIMMITVACNDFLEETAPTIVSKKVIFASEATMRGALYGVHSQMSDYWYRTVLYNLNSSLVLGCPFETVSNTVSYGVLDEVKPENNILNSPFYQQAYKVIEHANVLIDCAPTSPVSDDEKRPIVAEAKFLRAITFFDLIRLYGRVPLKLTPTYTYEDAMVPRHAMKDIYAAIIADLEDAFAGMPITGKQVQGMPTRWAAKAYLSKIYAQIASLTDDHLEATRELGEQPSTFYVGSAEALRRGLIPESDRAEYADNAARYFWMKAYTTSKEVIEKGGYSLVVPFGQLFRGRTRNTTEAIFEHQYKANNGFGAAISSRTSPDIRTEFNLPMMENVVYAQITAGYSVFESHFMKYCRKTSRVGEKPTAITEIIDNRVLNSDPRFNETYAFYQYLAYVPKKGGTQRDSLIQRFSFPHKEFRPDASNSAYPFIKKHLDSTQVSAQMSNVNFIVLRLADIQLICAESLNELGRTDEAISLVNTTILDRARRSGKFDKGKEPFPLNWSLGLDRDSVRQSIMEEREYELLGEGHETMDVRRRGVEYLRKRIDKHDSFYYRYRTNNYWWEVRNWPGGVNPTNKWTVIRKFHMIYSEMNPNYRDPSRRNDFCKKHLFLPFPQRELNMNSAIPLTDQNFGWQ